MYGVISSIEHISKTRAPEPVQTGIQCHLQTCSPLCNTHSCCMCSTPYALASTWSWHWGWPTSAGTLHVCLYTMQNLCCLSCHAHSARPHFWHSWSPCRALEGIQWAGYLTSQLWGCRVSPHSKCKSCLHIIFIYLLFVLSLFTHINITN